MNYPRLRLPTWHYIDERLRHKEHYAIVYPTPKEATKIIKKLRRHFKLSFEFSFPNINRGIAFSNWSRCYHIELPYKDISLGLICHEVAHALSRKKYDKPVNHNKKYQRQCDRVCKWARRYLPQQVKSAQEHLLECNLV